MDTIKLIIYVLIASITTFLAQFGVQVIDKGIENLYLVSDVVWVIVATNTVLAGLIAAQAKLSDAPRQTEKMEALEERQEALINTIVHKVDKQ